jgi:hypothetical protein
MERDESKDVYEVDKRGYVQGEREIVTQAGVQVG